MNANKITLAGYIVYLQSMYKRYGNISIAQLKHFPEDMSESSTIDELVSEGDNMYDALKEAVELIHDLAVELEYKDAVEG